MKRSPKNQKYNQKGIILVKIKRKITTGRQAEPRSTDKQNSVKTQYCS